MTTRSVRMTDPERSQEDDLELSDYIDVLNGEFFIE